MLASIVSSTPSTSILSSSTQKRRSVTFSTDSNISNGVSKKTALTTSATAIRRSDETGMNIEDESYYGYVDDSDYIDNDDEDEYLYYHKEKWNPNSPINPMYKSDVCHYDDDDVSLSMEDVFPTRSTGTSSIGTGSITGSNSAAPRRTNHNSGSCDSISITDEFTTANSSQTSLLFLRNMKRIDLLHGTHNLNVDYDFDDLDTSSTQNDDDDDYLLPPSHRSSTIANTENDDNDEEEAQVQADDGTNIAQPSKHSQLVDTVTSKSMTGSTKKTTNSKNKNKNHEKSSTSVNTNVSLQDYFERGSQTNSTLSSSHKSAQVITTTTKATNESVTSSTMDNTSWNDESISSCTSQVLLR